MRHAHGVRILLALAFLTCGAATSAAQSYYAAGEFLNWRVQDAPLPTPLLTTTNGPTIGGYMQPGTRVVLGDGEIGYGNQLGGRFTVGAWLDDGEGTAVEASFFFLERGGVTRSFVDNTGSYNLGFPYFDAVARAPAVKALSGPSTIGPSTSIFVPQLERFIVIPGANIPGATAGVNFQTRSQLLGGEGNGFLVLERDGVFRVDGLAGFRYLRLQEDMQLDASSLQTPSVPGDMFVTRDTVATANNFYGAQVGVRGVFEYDIVFLALTGKVGGGPMVQQVTTAGSLRTTQFGTTPTGSPGLFPSGMYAQRTNSGHGTETRFALVSEAQATGGIQVASFARVFAGYSILYVANVARPGNQIDPSINPNQSEAILSTASPPGLGAGPIAPLRQVNQSSFWAQGISIGLELRY